MAWSPFPPYVSAAEKRARAAAAIARLRKLAGKKGRPPEPVTLEGRRIATSFWGKAWCDNLESYADFAYRLERGRGYVRSGAVVDLHLVAGRIEARVSGSELYEVQIDIERLRPGRWKELAGRCAGAVSSLVGLLRGELPDEVMRAVTDRQTGLFPEPRHIQMRCSCPDAASLCKHVAASLYGVGTRLDARPELLFQLRGVDPQDLVEQAAAGLATAAAPAAAATLVLDAGDLGALFGIEVRAGDLAPAPAVSRRRRAAKLQGGGDDEPPPETRAPRPRRKADR
jgi:uncharacterized Zn finger protein